MKEQNFVVVDGMYTSEVFATIEEARTDAKRCAEDEGFSGHVEIRDAETGEMVEVVKTDGAGNR